MAMTKEQIRSAAMQLDPAERESLAEELLLSVSDAEREEIERAWLEEARRRTAAYKAGLTAGKPVNEVLDRLTRKIRP